MSTVRVKDKCHICSGAIEEGPAIFVKYCELSKDSNGSNPQWSERLHGEYRVVWKGKSKNKIEGAVHIKCWGQLIENKEKSKLKVSLSKSDRLGMVE